MSVTLTVNYREIFAPDTIDKIDILEGDNYHLPCMLEFIDEHSEEEFVRYYEEYIEAGEKHTFEAIDAFISLHGLDELDRFERSYIGEFSRPEHMAEEYLEHEINQMSHFIVVDWDSTAVYLLEHDVDRVGDFYFRTYF